ncbi:endonuclease [Haloprofundus marisrubri]|uniref:tRNA-splicing endonuclease n=1 Tax=Haloprofundus marisrubri TaxID=1514971 RepID=A0A0W1REB9_9EURY|nr:tRNA-intron lyase [Haloprofundus marisrubri]KTG11627.1 endonuclease [Haloprofundus marisrubri]
MHGHARDDAVRVGGNARQQFHDARGYGAPVEGNEIDLAPVEAAHLLYRGDLDSVDGDGFRDFFVSTTDAEPRFALQFLVYADLRERGFYLLPAREPWVDADTANAADCDFVVFPRGKDADDGVVEHCVRVVGERASVSATEMAGYVFAVVDEESELTYLEASEYSYDGETAYDPPTNLEGDLLDDRAVCWNAPEDLFESGFYGQPLSGRDADIEGVVQLSLLESASLVADGALLFGTDDDHAAVVERGRAVEGERFDRRLRVYDALRERNVVPKTGFKFGADFRTYASVDSVEDLGHSETLVRVVQPDHSFAPRDLSLDVRLAGGVRKRMVFALTDANEGIDWLSVGRLTP